jgi:hypothetical protein
MKYIARLEYVHLPQDGVVDIGRHGRRVALSHRDEVLVGLANCSRVGAKVRWHATISVVGVAKLLDELLPRDIAEIGLQLGHLLGVCGITEQELHKPSVKGIISDLRNIESNLALGVDIHARGVFMSSEEQHGSCL